MNTDSKAKGKRDSNKSIVDKKSRPAVSKSDGKSKEKKNIKPSGVQFTNIIDKINEGFVSLDTQMNYTFVSQRAGELLGRKPEELISKNYWEEYPFAKDTSFGRAYLQALETQSVIELADYYEPANRWIQNRIYPSESGLSIFFNDITENRRKEQALREKDEQIRRVTDVTPTLLSECNRELRYLFVNRAAAEFLGFPAEEIIGRPVQQIMGDEAFKRIHPYIERVLTGERVEFEAEIPYPGVGSRFVHVVYVPKRDEADHVIGWLATVTDMTERQQAEEKLYQSEQRFRILSNTVPSLVWSTAPDGTIQYVNEHWHNYTGLSFDESISNWEQLLHPDDAGRVMAAWTHALATVPDEYLMEVRYRRNDGRYRWFQSRAVPARDEKGTVTAWYGVTTDIHDRYERETELESVINHTPFMLTRCTKDLRYRFVSRAYAEMIGRSPEEVAGKSIVEVMGEEGLKTISPYIEQVLQGKRVEYETEVSFEGIGAPALHVIYTPDYDEQGNVVGWFASIADVTARKTAENEKIQLLEREQIERANAEQAKAEAQQAWAEATRELSERKLAEAALGTWTDTALPQDTRSPWLNYGISLAVTAIAITARYILDPLLGNQLHFTPLFGAIAFSVWYGGLGPALLSTLLGYLAVEWLFMEPRYAFDPNMLSFTSLAVFLASSTIVISLGNTMRRAQRHAHQSARVAVERKREAESRLVEQKRVEEALRESERKFSLIYHKLPFAATLSSPQDGTIVDVNEQFEGIFGYNKEEAVGKTSIDLGINPDAEGRQRLLHEVQAQGSVRNLEIELVTRSNGKRIFLTNSDVVDIGGEKYNLNIVQDITKRKQIEQELERERELLDRLFQTMPVMVSMFYPETNTMQLNQEFERTLGWKGEEVTVASLLEDLYPDPEYRSLVLQRMATVGKNEWIEVQVKARDGRTVDSLWSNISIMDGERIVRGIALGIDITERKQAERTLSEYARQQATLYQLADQLQHLDSPIGIYDAALDAILNALQCDRASILLFDETDAMHFVAWRGLSDEYRKATDGHSPWNRDAKDPEPISMDDIDAADLSDSLKEVIRNEGISSLAFIPLVSEGQLIGKFMVYFHARHRFSETEIELSQTIAHQLSAAIERQRAEEELRKSAQFDAYRVLLNDTLRPLNDTAAIQSAALRLLGEQLQVERVVSTEIDEANKTAHIIDVYVKEGISKIVGPLSLDDFPKSAEYLRAGRNLILSDTTTAPELDDTDRASCAALGVIASMAVPVIKEGRWIASLGAHQSKVRNWSEQEIQIMEETAERTWIALERARAQQDLRRSETLYRTIARSIPGGGVYVVDKEFRYVVADGPVTEAFDLTREMLEGHTVAEVFTGEQAERMETRLRKNFAGETVSYETAHKGRVYWTQQAPLHDSIGHAVIVTLDITERKNMEEALRQSEARFSQFMQHLPGLAWIKDIDGRYVYANAAAEKAFQTPRAKLYGRTDEEVFPAEVAAQFRKNDERALKELRGVQMVEELEHDDRLVHYSLVTKFPIPGPDGSIAMIGGTALDITDRIHMEKALHQARKRAEQTADRIARLQDVTASLVRATTPAQLAELILEQGTRATGATASILVEVVNDGNDLKTVAALGYPPTAVRTEPVPLTAPTPISDCILSKQAIWLGSQDEFAKNYPELAEARRSFGHEATVALPLMVGDRALGGLAFSFVTKRDFPPEEREFFLSVAQQCAQGFERAHGAEALRDSEERYRAIVNQATAGIVRKDANGRIVFVNDAFCAMLGYDQAELMGRTMWQVTHKEDVLENRRLFVRLMAEGIPFQLEKRLLRRNDSILWVTVSVSPVLNAAGKPESAVSVYADITERKQAEMALNESRERFRNLFNLVPIAVYTCTADGLIQQYNRRAAELWGREPFTNDPSERYCGSFKIYYPDGRFMPHKNCPMARMLRGETLDPSELEIIIERRDGSRRNVIAHPLPLKNEYGQIVSAINCLYDITDRKQAERRLALLAEISELTRKTEDPIELMSSVSEAVGRHFQVRRCLFNEIDLENDIEIVHRDYHDGIESAEGLHTLTDYSSITTSEITTGKTIVNHDSKADPRTAHDYERTYLKTGERSYVAVPLKRDERWVSTLWISDDAPREWSETEVSLLETVAERTWTAAEKLRIHAALRDSEERLRVTFNITAVGFATLTPTAEFVDVNEAFCDIVGYSRAELLRMNYDALTHPSDVKRTQDHISQLLSGEVPSFVIEKLFIRKDGQEMWVQNSVSLVRGANRVPLHLILISQDITARKQTEAALYELNVDLEQRVLMRTIELSTTNERLLQEIEERTTVEEALRESDATTRLILDTSPDAIIIANHEGRIMRVNAQIDNLFQYQPDEVIGKKIEVLIPDRFHQRHIQHRASYTQHAHRRPMGVGLELFGKRKDGSEFSIDVMLTPLQNQALSDWETMVTIRDSTERKRMEADLRESHKRLQNLSQRLVEVQEEERRAIARELHDRVGQSLAALNLNLTIIHNQLSNLVDEHVNLRLTDSMQLVAEVIALVRDVMSNLRPTVLDDYGLEAALHTTLENFKSRYGINIRLEKNQTKIPRLNRGIEMTLLRITQEAILNVVRHAQATDVRMALQLEGNIIRLSVEDNGVGIQSWTHANRPGSHGLRIMRERAEAVGGDFKVSSQPGQGTKLEVNIPVQYETPKE
jgi:PAS domain S-box-containing protein